MLIQNQLIVQIPLNPSPLVFGLYLIFIIILLWFAS